MSYQQDIRLALDRVYTASACVPFELRSLCLAIVSDLHRGAGDDADDFKACATAFAAALDHYWTCGHILAVLGDAEELWECRPEEVVSKYRGSLRLEKPFLDAGRYWRFVGNHDEDWVRAGEVERHLAPILGPLGMLEGLRLRITERGRDLGEIFLVHGHQGTLWSDRLDWLSHALLRAVWRPIQRLTDYRTTTPATNWRLGRKHEFALYRWAAARAGVILLAGHTHHPVFPSPGRFEQIRATYDEVRRQPEAYESEALEQLEADLAFARAMEQPCYLNDGCGCFSDGSLTAIEIANGSIRLVRWRMKARRATRRVLASARLKRLLADVAFAGRPAEAS